MNSIAAIGFCSCLVVPSIAQNVQGAPQSTARSDTLRVQIDTEIGYEFPAKPRDTWELGLHAGHFFIDGDVDRIVPGGYGVGLHLRKAVNYTFSVRMNLFYGKATGLDPQPSASNLLPEQNVFSGYGPENPWFFSHKTQYVFGTLEGIINIGNILFHNRPHKWNIYGGVGIGMDSHQAMLDLRDENGNLYTDLIARSGYSEDMFDTRQGRKEIKDALKNIYDGKYETEGPKKQGIFRLGDDTNLHILFTASVGLARKLSKRVNLALEHQLLLSDNDYLDGQKWRTQSDQSNSVDIGHYTSFRLGINLGSFEKRTEPMYWLNPVDVAFRSINKLEFQVLDSDCDGVPDEFDVMTTSCDDPCMPVDTKGRPVDSDSDGIPDCKDCEPHSAPGFPVNECGKVEVVTHTHGLDTAAILAYIRTKCPLCEIPEKCEGNWYLPMINFDLDKHLIKPEFYSHLFHIASALNECPDLCIVVNGFTDNRYTNDYNLVLSYNRANEVIDYMVSQFNIDRTRLILRYGGEEQPIIRDLPDRGGDQIIEKQHYKNRRVEFSACSCIDNSCPKEMNIPENARSGSQGGKSKSSN